MRKVFRRGLSALISGSVLFSLSSAPAFAADHNSVVLNDNDREYMQNFWDANGVSAETQEALFQNIEAGVWPQSETGDVDPVSTETVHRNGNAETVATYPDGSIVLTAVQESAGSFDPANFGVESLPELQEKSGMSLRAIQNCKTANGSGYSVKTDCAIFGSSATVAAGFIASYQIVDGQYNDSILRHGSPYQKCSVAKCDTPYLGTAYLKEQVGRKAQVTYLFRWTNPGGSSTGEITLLVGANAASSSFRANAF